MIRLSRPAQLIREHYDVVVVGSGYGGSIAASRLARAGRKVCLLERGKEMHPGEYPDELHEIQEEFQTTTPLGHIGPRTGMYDLRLHRDISVFLGCGLGGTSLVNANVSLQADDRVFNDPRWPAALREDMTALREGYDLARQMLGANPLPDAINLRKLEALEASSKVLPGTFYRPPINVTFQDRVNEAGVSQHACTLCGDCVSGCNFWAKNTVLMNYLPDACNHGAEIFTQVPVRWVEHTPEGWLVHYQILDSGREDFHSPEQFVAADLVILAAGTLGTTEILLRSKAKGLATSAHVGQHFTSNGDVLGFSYDTDREIDGIGWGDRRGDDLPNVGPCITGIIDIRDTPDVNEGMVIEEGSLPGGLRLVVPGAMALGDELLGKESGGILHRIKDKVLDLLGSHMAAAEKTQTYLVMAHDSGTGTMVLNAYDQLEVHWPALAAEPVFTRIKDNLVKATEPLHGRFLEDPLAAQHLHDLITVHPLGGCIMAENGQAGVVNHLGQVFTGDTDEAYEGLYACDGSVIPRPLGVNPLLTISALAERTCRLLAERQGWTLPYDLPSAPPGGAPDGAPTVGIQFTERMAGWFSTGELVDYQAGYNKGKASGSSFDFILSIASENLEAMIADATHPARMVGIVRAPALSPEPLEVSDGAFNLFVNDPTLHGALQMHYAMRVTTQAGRSYFFKGFKEIFHDKMFDMWSDTTTQFITVYDGADDSAAILGRGILRISPIDFARQLTTMHALNAPSKVAAAAAVERFGKLFAGALFHVYASIIPKHRSTEPAASPEGGA